MKETELTCITSARSKTFVIFQLFQFWPFHFRLLYAQTDNTQVGGWNHLEVQKVAVLKSSLLNLIQFKMTFRDIFFFFFFFFKDVSSEDESNTVALYYIANFRKFSV